MRLILTTLFVTLYSCLAAQDRLKVVSSISIINDIAQQLGGDLIDCSSIVPLGFDPHTYESTPQDVVVVAEADMIIMNGLTLEGWLGELIRNANTEALTIIASEGIDALESMEYQNSYDPHAWMTASNGIVYAQNIAKGLVQLLPEKADEINSNLASYLEQLKSLDQEISEKIMSIPEAQRVLITSHDAFQYYGRRYGLQLESIQGTSTEAEVRTSDILRVSEIIRKRRLPAIFVESTISPKLMNRLASDNGTKLGGELFSDSLGEKDGPASSYLDMLKHNTDVIVKALSGSGAAQVEDDPEKKKPSMALYFLGFVLLLGVSFFVFKGLQG